MTDLYKLDTIWHTRTLIPTPLGMASQLGWLREEFQSDGIAVRMVDDAVKRRFASGSAWLSMPNLIHQGGNAPAMGVRAAGFASRVIGLTWIDESQFLVTLPQSGLRRPRDLRGRRIGLPRSVLAEEDLMDHRRASALRCALTVLETDGLTYKDVEFIDLAVIAPPHQRLSVVRPGYPSPRPVNASDDAGYARELYALIRNEVDAVYLRGPLAAQWVHALQLNVVMDLRHHPDPLARVNCTTPRPITVPGEFLNAHRDWVVRFLTRVVSVGPWVRAHPQVALEYIARQSGSTTHWVRAAYGVGFIKGLATDLDEFSIAGMAAYKQFLLQWGFIKRDFSIGEWIDPSPLEEALRRCESKVA